MYKGGSMKTLKSRFKAVVLVCMLMTASLCFMGFASPNSMSVHTSSFDYEYEIVPTKNVTLAVEGGQTAVKPSRQFKVVTTQEPWYTTTVPIFEVIDGNAVVDNTGLVTVSADAEIGSTITVKVTADGLSAATSLTVEKIPAEQVTISYQTDIIQAGTDFTVATEIIPIDTSYKLTIFEIVSGGEYATIKENRIFVKPSSQILIGNAQFGVRATVDGVYSNTLVFSIYVPVESVVLSADKLIAASSNASGDTIQLSTLVNSNATYQIPAYEIISGAEFIDGVITNGVLHIKQNITNPNAQIKVRAIIDGVYSQIITIGVYIPVNNVSISYNETIIQAGTSFVIPFIINPVYSSIQTATFEVVSGSEFVTVDGYNIVVKQGNEISVGDAEFSIRALIDGKYSNILTFGIYVPVNNVVLTTNKIMVTSSSFIGDTIELSIAVNENASVKEPTYKIISGAEYIEGTITTGGIVNIKSNINNPNAQIVISVIVDGVESNAIVISIYVPVESVALTANKLIGTSSSTSGDTVILTAVPEQNSTTKTVTYEIISGNEFANLSNNILSVKSNINNPTATIIIKATIENIVSNTLTISVYIPVETVVLSANKTTVNSKSDVGDIVQLFANIGQNSTVKTPIYSLASGNEFVASLDSSGLLTTKSNIQDKNAKIKVKVTVDGLSSNIIEIPVHILTESVTFTGADKDKTTVQQQLNYNFGAVALPNYASDIGISYSLNVASNIATISSDGVLSILATAPIDTNIIITAKTADNVTATKTVTIERVNGDNISYAGITKNGATFNEVTNKIRPNESLVFGVSFLPFNTTDKTYTIQITQGSALATVNGDTLTIKALSAMNADNPIIKVKLVSTANSIETAEKTIYIYVPAETVSFAVSTIDRGTTVNIAPTLNSHGFASDKTITFISSTANQSGITPQISSGSQLFVPQNATAGTVITIKYKTADNITEQTKTITVNALNTNNFSVAFDTAGDYKSGTTTRRTINVNVPQLEESFSIDMFVKYANIGNLSLYGLTVSRSYSSNATLSNIDTAGKLTLTALPGQSGVNNNIAYTISIADGMKTYIYSTSHSNVTVSGNKTYMPIKTVRIFNQNLGTVTLNKMIADRTATTQFGVNSIAPTSSIDISTAKFYLKDGTGLTLSQNGLMNVISNSATRNPIFYVIFTASYNGITITKQSNDFAITLPTITLNQNGGGDGTTSIIAINGLWPSITKPTRTGYIFNGYYSGSTQYFNSSGNLTVTHSNYSTTTLTASWSAITYYVTYYYNYGEGDKRSVDADTGETIPTYTRSYDVTYSTRWAGEHFDRWEINGNTYSYNREISYSNLTTTNGASIKIVAIFTQPSCVASGTMITLADGTQKAVENLDGTEMLLVWNLYTGQFDAAPILFIDSHGEKIYNIIHLYFSDGTDVKVIDEHGFWDYDLNKYIYLTKGNASEFIGHWFNKIDDKVQLIDVVFKQEFTIAWSPITYGHFNYYVNGMLSVPAKTDKLLNIFNVDTETMQYNQEQFNADIEQYGLFDYESDFAGIIPSEIFDAFNAQYLKIAMAKGYLTEEELLTLIEEYSKFFN
jgi:uncharacterized repeat protein (TIGR02543 family)